MNYVFSCVLCRKDIAINILVSSHGEGKCTGDRKAMKDNSGNKGKYERVRASCIVCRIETIISRLGVHIRKSHPELK